jgi:hypothetical protein
MQDSGIGGLQRHIHAAAHGDADISSGERRCVIYAVTDLGHGEALRL